MRPSFKHALRRLAVGGIIMVQLNTVAFKAWADSIAASATLGNQTAQMGIQMLDPSAAQKTLQDLFPDLQGGGTASLEEVYGDDSATLDAGIQANTRLRSESSMDGEAYRILVDSGKRPAVDLRMIQCLTRRTRFDLMISCKVSKRTLQTAPEKTFLKNARLHHTSRITAPVSA